MFDAWMETMELEADRKALLGIEVTSDELPPLGSRLFVGYAPPYKNITTPLSP